MRETQQLWGEMTWIHGIQKYGVLLSHTIARGIVTAVYYFELQDKQFKHVNNYWKLNKCILYLYINKTESSSQTKVIDWQDHYSKSST